MKHFLSVLLLFFFTGFFFKTQAQQKHFIYIQSENQQPFAVVMNGKVYSSSDYGYVILPKLTDGNYSFTVSFPMNKYPDQNFKCVINKKDLGYKLSNTSSGWALQNMQTEKNIAANSTANNDFTNMLSDVVNDSNLANKNLPANTFKHDTVAATANTAADTVTSSLPATVDTSNVASSTVNIPANNNNVTTDSVAQLQKISESKQDTGTNMVFVDKTNGNDTIKVFVPSDSLATTNTVASVPANSNVVQPQQTNETTDTATTTFLNNTSTGNIDTTTHAVGNPFYKSDNQNTNSNTGTPPVTNTTITSTTIPANTNSIKTIPPSAAVKEDCGNMISDNDLEKIKRKMFVQGNDNDMVQAALKYLKDKCITTDQVKTLGNIFSSDDGRYSLYDALYKNVYDYGNYPNLESQIIDPYYKRRFEAMLR